MAPEVRSLLRFGDVEIDAREGRILRDGRAEHLRQKVFQVLLYLIEHRDRAVSKDELMAKVWPDTAVTDDAVVQCIVDLRRVLGDDARNPLFIRTVPKRGYRFVAPEGTGVASVEIEATESVEYEVVEDTPAATPRVQMIVIPALAVAVVLLSGVTWMATRGRAEARQASMPPIDSPTRSDEALRLYNEGVELIAAFQPEDAIERFEKALEVDPQFAMARARIGYVHGLLNYEVALARPHLEQALAMSQRNNEHERQQMQAWLDTVKGRYGEAIQRYRLILDRWPTDVESHRNLAKLLAGEEQIAEAIEVLERARAIEPRSPQILNSLLLYSLIGRHDEAISAQRRHVEVAPLQANAWDSLGLAQQWAGKYGEALDAYARALELRPDFEIVRHHRAGVYVQLGRFRDAIADVQECVNLAKSPAEIGRAYGTLAEIHRIRGDEIARRSAEAQIPEGSGWAPALSRIDADPASWKEDPSIWETNRIYSGRGARGDRRAALFHSGYAAMRSGRTEEALDLYRRALRFRPLTWYVEPLETCLADALFELKRYEEAVEEYRRVLGINPNYARARFGLAQSLDALGRRDEARAEYERFVALWKDADRDARDLVLAKQRLIVDS
jgi:tetratricopeptide (TPR) repeat protein/DNA-binding winged helix-turn-helix (wHTH) protein